MAMINRTVLLAALCLGVAGCQTNTPGPTVQSRSDDVRRAFASAPSMVQGPISGADACRGTTVHRGALAGRTLRVNKISDIKLAQKEVVLTFDDGPIPKRTGAILATLKSYGVGATFFVVGQMARSYPSMVRKVAQDGHTVGHHTNRHANLRNLSRAAALKEIAQGERAVSKALSGSGQMAAPFFRFPYLAHTTALRRALAERGTVVIDPDIDSKDYFRQSSDVILRRTMRRLRRKGKGVLLFHDIHARTVRLMPKLLARLKADGYSVVHLVPARDTACGRPTA
ncbi:MAG: polysaccharide deacetylase family protein [Pseudomonadota bacterium]